MGGDSATSVIYYSTFSFRAALRLASHWGIIGVRKRGDSSVKNNCFAGLAAEDLVLDCK